MTAILISNMREGNANYLYLAADRRVTSGDKLVSDNNKKIFTRTNGQVTRYYATAGDVGPTDYLIDKFESMSMSKLQESLFEDDLLKTIKGTMAAFIVEVTPTAVMVYELYIEEGAGEEEKNTMALEKLSLEELETEYRVLGSGGYYVKAALAAIKLNTENKQNNKIKIEEAFKAAASTVLSINNKVDLFRFKLQKQTKGKK